MDDTTKTPETPGGELDISALQARFNQDVRAAKREIFEAISAQTEVFVAMNLEHEGVRIPEHLRKGDRLTLKFSQRYEYKLEVLDEGVAQILRFGGEDFPVFVAWDAIFIISEQKGRSGTWPWSAPKALRLTSDALLSGEEGDHKLSPDGVISKVEYIH